jgi:TetR/AcrR family transcriptional regulator, transcriptional repressor for nem operon
MRVSKEKAAENRERILSEAARLFREHGPAGVGVNALTEAAGMTHGSLYSQFGSKDNLLAEALHHGYAQIAARSVGIASITEALSMYLSPMHRENPGKGCYMAALGCEMSRQSKPVRAAFTEIVRDRMKRFGAMLSRSSKRQQEDDALAILSGMVGAMVLARAVDDPELSDRILSVTRARLVKASEPSPEAA